MKKGSMRIELKAETISKIEKIAGERLTTRCDRVINKALDSISKTGES